MHVRARFECFPLPHKSSLHLVPILVVVVVVVVIYDTSHCPLSFIFCVLFLTMCIDTILVACFVHFGRWIRVC